MISKITPGSSEILPSMKWSFIRNKFGIIQSILIKVFIIVIIAREFR